METWEMEQAVAAGIRRNDARRSRNAVVVLLVLGCIAAAVMGLVWWDDHSHPANIRIRQINGR